MGYINGNYVPDSFETILGKIITGINDQYGESYTVDTFTGTNFYKYAYAIIQMIMADQADFADTFSKLQDYINVVNAQIEQPCITIDGMIKALSDAGYVASFAKPTALTAGEISGCVDVDDQALDYLTKKAEILQILADCSAAGAFFNGSETGTVTMSNGQVFDFAYDLPTLKPTWLKITITISNNTREVIDSTDDIKTKLLANINEFYALGKDFEPEKYYEINRDAKYAANILLEYSFTGVTYVSTIYSSNYKDKLTFDPADITVILS